MSKVDQSKLRIHEVSPLQLPKNHILLMMENNSKISSKLYSTRDNYMTKTNRNASRQHTNTEVQHGVQPFVF